jgi:hypothetical protein
MVIAGFPFGFSESAGGSTPVVAQAANQFTEQVNISPQEFFSCANDCPDANPTNDDTRKIVHGFI